MTWTKTDEAPASFASVVATAMREFRDYMDTHVTTAGRLLVVGDFNLHIDDKEDNDTIRFKELLQSLNLQQHITCPTHKQGHTRSTDYSQLR